MSFILFKSTFFYFEIFAYRVLINTVKHTRSRIGLKNGVIYDLFYGVEWNLVFCVLGGVLVPPGVRMSLPYTHTHRRVIIGKGSHIKGYRAFKGLNTR